jgi:ABC-type polar amino acid transport system ATPase subunit
MTVTQELVNPIESIPPEIVFIAGIILTGIVFIVGLYLGYKNDAHLPLKSTRVLTYIAVFSALGLVISIFKIPSLVFKEVKYAPLNCDMPKEEAEQREESAINAVNLSDYFNQNPLKLSMGQKQRVAVASALAMTPKIIVLDEPTTGQDPRSLKGIMDLMLKEYQNETNIIMVTHDMNLVDQVANRVIVMSNNSVIADGDTDTIFRSKEILEESNLKPPIRVQMLDIIEGYLKG